MKIKKFKKLNCKNRIPIFIFSFGKYKIKKINFENPHFYCFFHNFIFALFQLGGLTRPELSKNLFPQISSFLCFPTFPAPIAVLLSAKKPRPTGKNKSPSTVKQPTFNAAFDGGDLFVFLGLLVGLFDWPDK